MKNIHRITPAGPAKSLVILLHGYGANGEDLIGLGEAWQAALPDTAFVSPDAPDACEVGGGGFQWWTLSEGLSPHTSANYADALTSKLSAFIAAEVERAGVTYDRTALVGFSQGGMLALHVGLRQPKPLACLVGLSCLVLPTQKPVTSPAPILMAHGMMDPIVPFALFEPSAHMLRSQGLTVETLVRHQMAHQIDLETLTGAGRFLARHLK